MSIKITKTSWRPFIELTDAGDNTLYFDVNGKVFLSQQSDGTEVIVGESKFKVKQSAKDILKAVEELIKDEQDRKLEEAEAYRKATEERASKLAMKLESGEK